MTFYAEIDEGIETGFAFDAEDIGRQVAKAVSEDQGCPSKACVNLLITDNEGIREFNSQYRGIDGETDVLSFPNLEFDKAGVFEIPEGRRADFFDPDSGELILGDIIISADRVREQAKRYGHSERREFAFLVAHSMFHLCGYDHMTEEEARVMEEKQEAVLQRLGITREEEK